MIWNAAIRVEIKTERQREGLEENPKRIREPKHCTLVWR